jgi:hypothetical protein
MCQLTFPHCYSIKEGRVKYVFLSLRRQFAKCVNDSTILTDLVSVSRVVCIDYRWRGCPEGPVHLLVNLAHLAHAADVQVEQNVLEKSLLFVVELKRNKSKPFELTTNNEIHLQNSI